MNKSRIVYRVNFEHLEVGQKVPRSEYFYKTLPQNKLQIENIFEDNKPVNKPSRFETIFVFKDEKDARDKICKIKGHFLYKVQISKISHEGDWIWLEEANKKLVEEAIVIEEIIVDESEKRAFRENRYNLPSPEEIAEGYGSWEPPKFEIE